MLTISKLRRMAIVLTACAPLLAASSATASVTTLTLINGWADSPFGTAKAGVETVKGIVHFRGAMVTDGTNPQPFVLPAPFRPSAKLYIPIDVCGHNGRLDIQPTGEVDVQPEGDFSNAQCFTSLDGASFALTSDGFKPLNLKHAWAPYGNGTATPAVRNIGGIVHFEGGMSSGQENLSAFVLPKALRPSNPVYVAADLAVAHNGRFEIDPDGSAWLQESGGFGPNFTSLDGISFSLDATGFTPLTLINGWFVYNGSAAPAVKLSGGVVYLRGAIGTHGTDFVPFVLPAKFRPAKTVFIPVDMCDATYGRIIIDHAGNVSVQAESDANNAKCFTSLDGVSFHR